MHALRTTPMLHRLVLAWVLLVLGVAAAAPVLRPQAVSWICAEGGYIRQVVVDESDAGHGAPSSHLLECALCLPAPMPSATVSPGAGDVAPALALRPLPARVHHPRLMGPPLPPRGPPFLG